MGVVVIGNLNRWMLDVLLFLCGVLVVVRKECGIMVIRLELCIIVSVLGKFGIIVIILCIRLCLVSVVLSGLVWLLCGEVFMCL